MKIEIEISEEAWRRTRALEENPRTGGEAMTDLIPTGSRVRINKPLLREYGTPGTVNDYDDRTQWYLVGLDLGPPWHGRYERCELDLLEQKS